MKEEPLLLGISGGSDSIALLYLLRELGYKNLILCHFNHQLRGKASDADADFVKFLAADLRLPSHFGSGNVQALAKKEGLSLETAARTARYEFFAVVSQQEKVNKLLLAHHVDDQLETIFFNLLRGSGSAGLAGMALQSQRTIGKTKLELIRPLLPFAKKEVLDYLEEKKIAFRHDASNDSLEPTRNRLRHRLFPLLDELVGTSYRDAMVRTASILKTEDEYLESLTIPHAREETLTTASLGALPLALQRRVIHAWLHHHGFCDIGFVEVERVRSLLNLQRAAKINLPKNRHARRRSGVIFLE